MAHPPPRASTNEDVVLHRTSILRAIAALFDDGSGEVVAEDDDRDVASQIRACGLIEGQRVTYRLIYEDHGDSKSHHTKVSAQAPPGLFLDIRQSSVGDQKEVDAGHARDMTFDDPAFDFVFIVDGAPERHVREVLDMNVRQHLVVAGNVSLSTNSGELAIEVSEWIGDSRRASAMLRAVGRIASKARLIREDGKLDASKAAGYRQHGGADINAPTSAAAADAGEIATALARRKERHRRRDRRLALLIVGFIVFVIALVVVSNRLLE